MDDRLLLIDDDATLVRNLHVALEEAGYKVDTAANGIEGIHKLRESAPDLVILDVIMPDMDGWETCGRIREASNVPILMVSGFAVEPAQELMGLQKGADMYMTKPFAVPVLVVRVNALLRRSRLAPAPSNGKATRVGDLHIDLTKRAATRRGRAIKLSKTEYRLLHLLASAPGRVVPNRELIRQLWGDHDIADQERSLKLYVHYLRQKIEDDPARPQYIRNRRGIGYLLTDPTQAKPRPASA